MSKWREVPVRELCAAIIDCVNKTAPTAECTTPYRMIRTTNVRHGRIDLSRVRSVERSVYEQWVRRGRPEPGDILLTREAPLGEVGMLRDASGVFLGQRLVMYRADPNRTDRNFLLYAMRSPEVQAQMKAFGSGSTVEHMRVPDCGELRIRCPDLSVQRRIGSFLAAFDELIEINERRIELLEDLARSLYREWFVRFRFPGHPPQRSKRCGVPAGWSKVTLSEVAEHIARGITPKYAEDGDWIVVNQRCIRNGRVSLAAARRHGRSVAERKRVQRGDILINSTGVGTLGRVGVFVSDEANVTVDSHVTIVRPARWRTQAWLGMTLRDRQSELEEMGVGSTGQTELGRDRLSGLRIIMPPEHVLENFSNAIWPLLTHSNHLEIVNATLARTRDLLLPRLVTGRLDISGIDLGSLLPDEAIA